MAFRWSHGLTFPSGWNELTGMLTGLWNAWLLTVLTGGGLIPANEGFFVNVQHQMTVICDALFNVAVVFALNHAERRNEEPSVAPLQFKPVSVDRVMSSHDGVAHQLLDALPIVVDKFIVVMPSHDVRSGCLTVGQPNAGIVDHVEWRNIVAGQQHNVPYLNRGKEFIQLCQKQWNVGEQHVVLANQDMIPVALFGDFDAAQMAQAASNCAVVMPYGIESLGLQIAHSAFERSQLRFHVFVSVLARLQIDIKRVMYVLQTFHSKCVYTIMGLF